MSVSVAAQRRQAWDDAVLLLLYEHPGLGGERLLAAVIEQANDAMARLREAGYIEPEGGAE